MKNQMTFLDFQKRFPDEDSCLEEILIRRYGHIGCCPKCKSKRAKLYRLRKRRCFECDQCHGHIYPLVGTLFEGTQISLTAWFFAIYLFATCRNGVSAKEIERQIGVTYQTAWRLGHKIRSLMVEDMSVKLRGEVEIDETLYGPRGRSNKRGWSAEKKTCLFAMIERGGRVRTFPVSSRKKHILFPIINANIIKRTMIYSDEFKTYKNLRKIGYRHEVIVHSNYEWKRGDCSTNTLEGHWSNLKKCMFGTFTWVSKKHLPSYLSEFDFRYNRRKGEDVFEELLRQAMYQ
jgi:transposase